MAESRRQRHATEPLYNIKAVVQKTGVPADTMRAWERRYGVPQPRRTLTGRRLYTDRDIALIRWLRDQTASGTAISQAIQQLRALGDAVFAPPTPARATEARGFGALAQGLLDALLAFDRVAADAVLAEAFALYPVEDVCLRLVGPALAALGERWRRGEATVAQEHFATDLLRQRLAGLLHAYRPATGRGLAIAAGAPEERHDLGLLMLAVFLVRRGWQVVYLGADLPQADLLATVIHLRPDLVCLSAAAAATAETLRAAAEALARLEPPPLVAFGGHPFDADPALRERVPGHYLGSDTRDAARRVDDLLA
ncbi:MAG TPA: cobalamin-dependent protein [Thermomicrobiales bacterium]|nr:cobalamin-dependent protein [Thermomicrobiales bacterium]